MNRQAHFQDYFSTPPGTEVLQSQIFAGKNISRLFCKEYRHLFVEQMKKAQLIQLLWK